MNNITKLLSISLLCALTPSYAGLKGFINSATKKVSSAGNFVNKTIKQVSKKGKDIENFVNNASQKISSANIKNVAKNVAQQVIPQNIQKIARDVIQVEPSTKNVVQEQTISPQTSRQIVENSQLNNVLSLDNNTLSQNTQQLIQEQIINIDKILNTIFTKAQSSKFINLENINLKQFNEENINKIEKLLLSTIQSVPNDNILFTIACKAINISDNILARLRLIAENANVQIVIS